MLRIAAHRYLQTSGSFLFLQSTTTVKLQPSLRILSAGQPRPEVRGEANPGWRHASGVGRGIASTHPRLLHIASDVLCGAAPPCAPTQRILCSLQRALLHLGTPQPRFIAYAQRIFALCAFAMYADRAPGMETGFWSEQNIATSHC